MYGREKVDLAKRAGQRRGWSSDTSELYGEKVVKRYKTFLATWRPAGGPTRVVLVDEPTSRRADEPTSRRADEPTGWRAYYCTDASASVADILTTVISRKVQQIGQLPETADFPLDVLSSSRMISDE